MLARASLGTWASLRARAIYVAEHDHRQFHHVMPNPRGGALFKESINTPEPTRMRSSPNASIAGSRTLRILAFNLSYEPSRRRFLWSPDLNSSNAARAVALSAESRRAESFRYACGRSAS